MPTQMTNDYGVAGATSPAKQKFVANAAQDPNYLVPATQDGFYSENTYKAQNGMPTTVGQNPNPNAPSGYSPQPTESKPADPYRAAFDTYLQSLQPSSEETAARSYLNTLTSNARMASEKALQSGETMGFAGGEEQRVSRNNNLAIQAATGVLGTITDASRNRAEILKSRAEFEGTMYKSKQESQKPFDLGQGQQRYTYNTESGKYEKTAEAPKVTEPMDPIDKAYKQAQTANIYSEIDARNKKKIDSGNYKIPPAARNNLMKWGISDKGVDVLEKDIIQYGGIGKALEVAGLDDKTKANILKELDKDYFSQL